MIRLIALVVGVCAAGGVALAALDRGDCRVAGSTLQFCDPAGVPCTTSHGKPGTCVQRPDGCQCVPGQGHGVRDVAEVCHFDERAHRFVQLSLPPNAAAAHLDRHEDDCLVDDDVACTADRCDRILGCLHDPDDSFCDDGLFCNGQEHCDPANGACVAVSACPPHIEGCLIINGACDEANRTCVDIADDSRCDDGRFCNGQETCDPATRLCRPALTACPPHVVNDCLVINGECDEDDDVCRDVLNDNFCDDENPCTRDHCIEGGFCASEAQCATDADCSPNLCVIGSCSPDGCCSAIDRCPVSGPGCTTHTGGCDPLTGVCEILVEPDGTPCEPANGSTQCENGCNGACQDGACIPSGPAQCPCFTPVELNSVIWPDAQCVLGEPVPGGQEWLIQANEVPGDPSSALNQAIADPDFCSFLVEFGPLTPRDVFAPYALPGQAEACAEIVRDVQDQHCPLP